MHLALLAIAIALVVAPAAIGAEGVIPRIGWEREELRRLPAPVEFVRVGQQTADRKIAAVGESEKPTGVLVAYAIGTEKMGTGGGFTSPVNRGVLRRPMRTKGVVVASATLTPPAFSAPAGMSRDMTDTAAIRTAQLREAGLATLPPVPAWPGSLYFWNRDLNRRERLEGINTPDVYQDRVRYYKFVRRSFRGTPEEARYVRAMTAGRATTTGFAATPIATPTPTTQPISADGHAKAGTPAAGSDGARPASDAAAHVRSQTGAGEAGSGQ